MSPSSHIMVLATSSMFDKSRIILALLTLADIQFKAQEPGTDDEVLQFCQLNYGVTFPIAKKVCLSFSLGSTVRKDRLMPQGDVNGADTQPIWKYLKENSNPPVKDIDWVCRLFSFLYIWPHVSVEIWVYTWTVTSQYKSWLSELLQVPHQEWRDQVVPRSIYFCRESSPLLVKYERADNQSDVEAALKL